MFSQYYCIRWVFKTMFSKGLVYRGYKVMPYSTACGTPISNFEAGTPSVITLLLISRFKYSCTSMFGEITTTSDCCSEEEHCQI
jgi:isoleucyl-tRNA synthetase